LILGATEELTHQALDAVADYCPTYFATGGDTEAGYVVSCWRRDHYKKVAGAASAHPLQIVELTAPADSVRFRKTLVATFRP